MSNVVPDLDVDQMIEVLATGVDFPLSPGVPVSQLDHALQTAALLAHLHPGDDELAAAGLVHDIGHLLPGGTDEAHADDAARAVRRALGERVAGIVGLHMEAKRYLVATDAGYGGVLTNDSVVSLGRQGGAMRRPGRRGLPGAAVGDRRRDVAARRRQREGRGPRGARPRQLGTPLACRQPARRCAGRLSGRPDPSLLSGHHRAAGPGRTLCGG